MDHGILLISEDDLDKLFEQGGDVSVPLELMSGATIKTSCYGLFLVGLDLVENKYDDLLLREASTRIDSITDSVAFHALSLMYPVDDMSLEGILKVAKAIILLENITHGQQAEDIPTGTVDTLVLALNKTLGLRANVIEMVSEDE